MSGCTSLLASVWVHHYLHAHVCLAFSVSDTKYAFTPYAFLYFFSFYSSFFNIGDHFT